MRVGSWGGCPVRLVGHIKSFRLSDYLKKTALVVVTAVETTPKSTVETLDVLGSGAQEICINVLNPVWNLQSSYGPRVCPTGTL